MLEAMTSNGFFKEPSFHAFTKENDAPSFAFGLRVRFAFSWAFQKICEKIRAKNIGNKIKECV